MSWHLSALKVNDAWALLGHRCPDIWHLLPTYFLLLPPYCPYAPHCRPTSNHSLHYPVAFGNYSTGALYSYLFSYSFLPLCCPFYMSCLIWTDNKTNSTNSGTSRKPYDLSPKAIGQFSDAGNIWRYSKSADETMDKAWLEPEKGSLKGMFLASKLS